MELLAPAGDYACLEAAIEAGADAVYLGLSLLNARRSARNFTPAELGRAVEIAEKHGVATHLTLNIDIARRETGAAARVLAMARDAGVTAVIVRDLAAVSLWRVMADMSTRSGCRCPVLHLSTQASVTNAEGARLAEEMGAARVVLARELALPEIRAIKEKAGIEVEVFAQGALCYSISGRCLMSSWGGGRSGNRGLCTSPCRAPWSVGGEAIGTAMSMRDLVTVDRLRELAEAGVDALKIEGRLKKPEWVREAVGLYREALGPRKTPGAPPPATRPDAVDKARKLAAYAGRDITSAYLDGRFHGLTGIAARKSGAALASAIADLDGDVRRPARPRTKPDGYALHINIGEKGVQCRVGWRGSEESWRMPRTRIKREKRALSVAELFERLKTESVSGQILAEGIASDPDFMLPPRNVKAILATVGAFLGRRAGRGQAGEDEVLKAPLPEDLRRAVKPDGPHFENRRRLGERPNQIRVTVRQLNYALLPLLQEVELVVQGATLEDMPFIEKFIDPGEAVFAFPEVYFPADSRAMNRLAEFFHARDLRVEANCWGSLWLCRRHKLRFSAGPGLAILNHLAAGRLRELGAEGATISLEADRRQIEDVSQVAALPLSLVVYARPPLAYTRIPTEQLLGGAERPARPSDDWTDRRGIGLHPERRAGVTVFRSLTPFSWAGIKNPKIKVANLVMDLSAEMTPLTAWEEFHRPAAREDFHFNYDRGLK